MCWGECTKKSEVYLSFPIFRKSNTFLVKKATFRDKIWSRWIGLRQVHTYYWIWNGSDLPSSFAKKDKLRTILLLAILLWNQYNLTQKNRNAHGNCHWQWVSISYPILLLFGGNVQLSLCVVFIKNKKKTHAQLSLCVLFLSKTAHDQRNAFPIVSFLVKKKIIKKACRERSSPTTIPSIDSATCQYLSVCPLITL